MPSPARQPPARDSGSGAGDARPRTRPHAPLAARGLSWSTAIHLGERRRPGSTASTGLMHHQGGRPAVALFTPSGGDGIEREARASAAGATSPAPARMRARVPRTALQRAAHHAAARTAPAIIAAKPAPAPGPGEPLPVSVAGPVSESFGVDLSRVRVHTTAAAAQAADALGARAFAYGSHVFLGRGERPTDLRLMAHELAHVVQQGGTATLQRWSTSGGDSHEHEAHRAAAAVGRRPFAVRERTPPRIQRLGIRDALDYFAGKANLIPGFRMFTIVLGVNPINMSGVDRSAANILRAVVELIPGGGLIVQALESNGVFDRVGSWVEQQISTLGLSGGSIRRAIDDFLGTLSLSDIFDLGGVWERAKRIFTEPIRRIIDFAGGLVSAIVKFIKDAILMPLAKLAEKTRGWDLLIAVLGRNPITGEPVPRNAETLIGGFMKLIGQEEIWENLKKSGAVARAWAWFQGAMEALLGFVGQIPALAIAAFESLELSDLILLPRAFAKVGAVFGTFLGKFFDWAGNAIWNLLEIIFDVVSPGALGYVKRTGAALKSIFKNPLPFVGNLVRAAKAGFQNFASNIGTHLKAGLIDWLTGSLPGVYIPKAFSIGEVVKFVFSVLGISWANVRAKLVKVVPGGETTVKILEKGFDIVVTLVTQGPAAAWEQIKGELSKLKDMVISGITDFVIDTVVKKAVPKLIALFIPGAGFISAILSIYDTVMVFVQKISKIIQVVTGFIDSIVAIASGDISAASKRVESVLAGLLSLAINFLAGFVGLGKVADKVMGVIGKVRDAVDKALDRVVAWIVATAKRLGKLVVQAGVPQDPNERLRLAGQAAIGAAQLLRGRVTQPLLAPILQGIQARYGLRDIRPYEEAGSWWVTMTANPTAKLKLVASAPATAVAWPVAVGAEIRVPNSPRSESVVALNPDDTITHTQEGGTSRKTREAFMSLWTAGRIYLSGKLTRSELTKIYGAAVAAAILSRGDLAANVKILDTSQAHHIIPIDILKKQLLLHELVRSGWDFNQAANGVALAEGFHGNHPSYSKYVDDQITVWIRANGAQPIAGFRTYVEGTLLVLLRHHIETAKRSYGTTAVNLNTYFERL